MTRRSEIRSAARLASVQALYQMELSGADANDVIAEFVAHRLGRAGDCPPHETTDVEHFTDLARGVVGHQGDIDRAIESALSEGWTLKRLDSTLRALLRSASFELLKRPDVPAKVVINEYVDVAHAFFDEVEPAFVNGVLDRLAHIHRASEFGAKEAEGDDLSAQR